MLRRGAATSTAPEAEAFNASIWSKFEDYHHANRAKLESRRLPRLTEGDGLKYLNNTNIEAHNQDQMNIKQSAGQLFKVIDGQLHEAEMPGVPGQCRIIYDCGDVSDAIVSIHVETGHRKFVSPMETVYARFHCIALQEVKWVLKQCLHCFPLRSHTRQQVDNAHAASSLATNRRCSVVIASTTLTSNAVFATLILHGSVGRDPGEASPRMSSSSASSRT
jgi:hypothetical protein